MYTQYTHMHTYTHTCTHTPIHTPTHTIHTHMEIIVIPKLWIFCQVLLEHFVKPTGPEHRFNELGIISSDCVWHFEWTLTGTHCLFKQPGNKVKHKMIARDYHVINQSQSVHQRILLMALQPHPTFPTQIVVVALKLKEQFTALLSNTYSLKYM